MTTKYNNKIVVPYFQASLASVNPVPVSEFLFVWEFRFTPLASRVLLSHWALMQVIARHQLSFRATRCSDLSVGLNPKKRQPCGRRSSLILPQLFPQSRAVHTSGLLPNSWLPPNLPGDLTKLSSEGTSREFPSFLFRPPSPQSLTLCRDNADGKHA